jgi:hypothetical protein
VGQDAALAFERFDLETDTATTLAQLPGQEAAQRDAGLPQQLG